VGLAVPICYGITLVLGLYAGYTINRVTLFALILALGLLVDDPITGVDNIERYLQMGQHPRRLSVILAMGEIKGALIMSGLCAVTFYHRDDGALYGADGVQCPGECNRQHRGRLSGNSLACLQIS
jgi:Cu/Ag efflux pump CusA